MSPRWFRARLDSGWAASTLRSRSGSLPPQSEGEVRANIATASNLGSTIDEYVQANASTQEAAALRDFADKPLVVLTAGIGNDATHAAAQDQLATLSTNSAHRVIDSRPRRADQ